MINPGQADQNFPGVSLPSFLQLLEHERNSCTLTVTSGGKSGCFFFKEGRLIDAACEGEAGIAAVRRLLAMEAPAFRIIAPEDRMERITQPLARILLHGPAAESCCSSGLPLPGGEAAIAETVKEHPLLRRLIAAIMELPAVRHYYLLNQKGKMIARSSDNRQLCNFITYAVMSSLQMRQHLGCEVKGPQSIQLVLGTGELLLILPGIGLVVTLLLDGQAATQAVTDRIRAALRPPKKVSG
ncbi:DUF4388 domain-containing protein [Candidatus Electronema sp. TJ]|uniref:DUF4388 domain-containing protein n=1 Tax=Candidatus Electronema sp. TJ TaxID=3401573 RepID=UPI003AA7AAA9